MVNQKPLPALPVTSALSVESRNHRIRHFLADILNQGSRADAMIGRFFFFKKVMDDFSERMDSGDWLSRIKRHQENTRVIFRVFVSGNHISECYVFVKEVFQDLCL